MKPRSARRRLDVPSSANFPGTACGMSQPSSSLSVDLTPGKLHKLNRSLWFIIYSPNTKNTSFYVSKDELVLYIKSISIKSTKSPNYPGRVYLYKDILLLLACGEGLHERALIDSWLTEIE